MFSMADRNRNSLLTITTVLLILTSVGKGAYAQCLTPLSNTVVYEGTLDTMLGCATGPNSSAWSVRSVSEASRAYQITKYDDTVFNTSLTGLYAFNQSGLIVRSATTAPTGGPISTAGTYIVELGNRNNRIAAKLVVIRSGPNCSCIQLASDAVNISCNIVYADHPVAPIKEIINCTANGQVYTLNTPPRTPIPYNSTYTLYVYNSTSTIIINNTAPATYDCKLTFAAPNPPTPAYLARNAPNFTRTFTVCESTTTAATSTTTTQPTTTTTKLPTTTTKPSTTTRPPTTTIQSQTTTTQPPTTTTLAPTTTQPPTTTTQPTTTIPSPNDIGLLAAKITLGTILGILMAALAVVGCSWCCLYFCPPLLPLRRPTLLPFRRPIRYFNGEIPVFQRREWIPVRRKEYWAIPFYQQSFSRYRTPYEYRLPSRYSTPWEYRLPRKWRYV